MKLNLLKAKIVEKGRNVNSLAEEIGTNGSSLYRKLNNFEKITIGDAKKIKAALGMSDSEAINIFLS